MRWFAGMVALWVVGASQARAEDVSYEMRFLLRASDAKAADYSAHRGMVIGSFGFGTWHDFVGSAGAPRCWIDDGLGSSWPQAAPGWNGGFEQKNLMLVAPGSKPLSAPTLAVSINPTPDYPGATSTAFPEGTRLSDIVEEYEGGDCTAMLDGVEVPVRLFIATVDVPR